MTCAAFGAGVWTVTCDGVRQSLTDETALVLQSFDSDLPVAGSKKERGTQIGNAIPVRLAYAAVKAATGWAEAEEAA